MKRFVLLGISVLLTGCQAGVQPLWSKAKPETLASFDPLSHSFYFHNSKDVSIDIDEASATWGQGNSFMLKGFHVKDAASQVRLADVEQLKASAQLQESINNLFIGMIKEAMPMLMQLTAPKPKSPNLLEAIIEANRPSPSPSSQPVLP